jgi:hypothetical protein
LKEQSALMTVLNKLDLDNLSDDQLARITAGDDPLKVILGTGK